VENLSEFEVRTVSEILGLLTQVTNLLTTIFSLRQLCVYARVQACMCMCMLHVCICTRVQENTCAFFL
jgi:hypothetical protein